MFFHKLLELLDADPDQAALAYDRLYRKLQTFFEGRTESARYSVELADECIDRLLRKIEEGATIGPPELPSYALGIARFVLLEHRKKPRLGTLDFDPLDPRSLASQDVDPDVRLRCLQQCLSRLTPEENHVVLTYYSEEKRKKIDLRRGIAAQSRQSEAALRVRVFRIRRVLEKCIGRCCKELVAVALSQSASQRPRKAGA